MPSASFYIFNILTRFQLSHKGNRNLVLLSFCPALNQFNVIDTTCCTEIFPLLADSRKNTSFHLLFSTLSPRNFLNGLAQFVSHLRLANHWLSPAYIQLPSAEKSGNALQCYMIKVSTMPASRSM